jgi:DNA-directed RNA polymerase
MAKHVWKAVNDVIFKGAEGMAYFKALADICSKDAKLMAWTTPLNFPVYHRYDQMVGKKIKLYLHDRDTNVRKRTQVTVLEKRDDRDNLTTPDKRKNRSSVSPNVIHSMDACHLQMTVLNAVDNHRVRDFFLIHDSFGVMPADCPKMFNAVRQSFVELYRDNCLYTMLADQVRDYIDDPDSVSFPEIPEKGDLDLEDVLRSQYCFL